MRWLQFFAALALTLLVVGAACAFGQLNERERNLDELQRRRPACVEGMRF